MNDYLIVDKEPEDLITPPDLAQYDEVNLESPAPTHIDKLLQGDIVFCLEVAEYVLLPDFMFGWISAFMKDKGKAYVSFPLVYPFHNEIELDSLRYTETGIRRLAKAANLEVSKIHYRRTKRKNADYPSLLTTYYKHDGMKMAKGIDHEITGYIVEFVK